VDVSPQTAPTSLRPQLRRWDTWGVLEPIPDIPPPPPAGAFDPVCVRPPDLVRPRRVGRDGDGDLTWRVASGPAYERVGKGLYVPRTRRPSVEQRIVDAAARLASDGRRGCVTAWAALRWWGAAYFDGRPAHGQGCEPVVLVTGRTAHLDPWPGVEVWRRGLPATARVVVDGVPVTTVQRALFDEIGRLGSLVPAVQAIDMAAAAGLISVWLFARYLAEANSMAGVPLARRAVALAADESRSGRETWLRVGLGEEIGLVDLVVNRPVFGLDGRVLGTPDLLDPATGTVIEYGGAIHLGAHRRREDLVREERMRAHGLEYVEIVRGDSRAEAARRVRAAMGRAAYRPVETRRWTLQPPPWWEVPETLDSRLERLGLAPGLIRH